MEYFFSSVQVFRKGRKLRPGIRVHPQGPGSHEGKGRAHAGLVSEQEEATHSAPVLRTNPGEKNSISRKTTSREKNSNPPPTPKK